MSRRSPALPLAVLIVALAQIVPTGVMADVVYLDEFIVTRASTTIFDDSFNRNITLNGVPPASVYSGINFPNGNPANYFVNGTIPESTANGGQAQLNTANGLIRTQPDPFLPVIQLVFATLETSTSTLTTGDTFTATGEFDLTVPSTTLGTYDIYLTNRQQSIGQEGNTLQIRVRECASGLDACGALTGPVLQFAWLDFINNQFTLINEVALAPADLANNQIALELSHNTGSDVITASYAFGNNGSFGSFTTLGSTGSSTDVFTTSLGFVRAGFEAFDPVRVPEPPPLLLLATALGALGVINLRRRRAQ